MSIRNLRTRLERLEARAGARYVIGKDRERDRKRREELFHLKRSTGLTDAQTAEMAEFDAFYEKEDRDSHRRSELFYKELYSHLPGGPGLTDAERVEYAELKERCPPNPNNRDRELVAHFGAIARGTAADGTRSKFESERERAPAEVEECVTSEAHRAAAPGRPDPNAAEKLKPASPDLMTDGELMPDEHNAEKARSEFGLAKLMGRIGNLYTKKGYRLPSS